MLICLPKKVRAKLSEERSKPRNQAKYDILMIFEMHLKPQAYFEPNLMKTAKKHTVCLFVCLFVPIFKLSGIIVITRLPSDRIHILKSFISSN